MNWQPIVAALVKPKLREYIIKRSAINKLLEGVDEVRDIGRGKERQIRDQVGKKRSENDRQVNKCIKKEKERDLLMFTLTNQYLSPPLLLYRALASML